VWRRMAKAILMPLLVPCVIGIIMVFNPHPNNAWIESFPLSVNGWGQACDLVIYRVRRHASDRIGRSQHTVNIAI
jgi:hypothetical protein